MIDYLHNRNQKSGFTLIELLVVIAIIGILASVVLASLNAAREHARDATRLAQMKEVEKALNLYFLAHGTYPNWVGSDTRASSCFTGGNNNDAIAQWDAALNVLVTEEYISSLPNDPDNTSAAGNIGKSKFCYAYHRSSSPNAYSSCRNKDTGEMYEPSEYAYLLYFSLEDPDNYNIEMNWNGNTLKPMNSCLPGPRR